jgi:hypothetical protein
MGEYEVNQGAPIHNPGPAAILKADAARTTFGTTRRHLI